VAGPVWGISPAQSAVTLANPRGSFLDGAHVLTNVNNTIQGAGQIGDSTFGFPTLVNQAGGTINANVSGNQGTDGTFPHCVRRNGYSSEIASRTKMPDIGSQKQKGRAPVPGL
jgi:hypothetical protein